MFFYEKKDFLSGTPKNAGSDMLIGNGPGNGDTTKSSQRTIVNLKMLDNVEDLTRMTADMEKQLTPQQKLVINSTKNNRDSTIERTQYDHVLQQTVRRSMKIKARKRSLDERSNSIDSREDRS